MSNQPERRSPPLPAGVADEAEIVELYKDTADELQRLLAYKLGNRQEAEEVAHDAYLKLYQLENRRSIRDLRRYLFAVSTRLALNVLRRRRTETRHERVADVADGRADENPSVYRLLLAEQRLERVRAALAALPEKTRYVFLLHRFEDLTYADIAARLGFSVKSVEYHMSRALEAVTAATADLAGPDD